MRVIRFLDNNFEKYLCSVFLVLMTVIMLYQIVSRFLGVPLSWTEETARYLFIWLIYLSAAYAAKLGAHITVDLLIVVFKTRAQLILKLFSNAVFFIFAAYVSYLMRFQVAKMMFVTHQVSGTGNWPMWIPYSSVLVGMFLIAVRLIQNSFYLIRDYKGNLNSGIDTDSKRGEE